MKQYKNEARKDYLFRVATVYLKKIDKNGDALENQIRYDEAYCDGKCLLEDMEMELDNE